jgi:hypothetical protein
MDRWTDTNPPGDLYRLSFEANLFSIYEIYTLKTSKVKLV